MKLTTRRLAVIGMLGGISILLGATPLGFIPIGPTKATIMHIPVIIGSIMEGPVAGLLIGLIFGVFSMFQAAVMPTSPVQIVFLDPLVAVLPRVLIGLVAYYSYAAVRKLTGSILSGRKSVITATVGAATLGTLTNTVGVLGMIYIRHAAVFAEKLGIDPNTVGVAIWGTAVTNGIPEIIVAILIVTAVVQALQKLTQKEL